MWRESLWTNGDDGKVHKTSLDMAQGSRIALFHVRPECCAEERHAVDLNNAPFQDMETRVSEMRLELRMRRPKVAVVVLMIAGHIDDVVEVGACPFEELERPRARSVASTRAVGKEVLSNRDIPRENKYFALWELDRMPSELKMQVGHVVDPHITSLN